MPNHNRKSNLIRTTNTWRVLSLIGLLFLCVSAGHAQTTSDVVRGNVTAELAEDGISDAVVLLVADSVVVGRTTTDFEGNYELHFRSSRIDTADQLMLVFKYVGYEDFVIDSLAPSALAGSTLDGHLVLRMGQDVVITSPLVGIGIIGDGPPPITIFPQPALWSEPALNTDRAEYHSFDL